VEQQIRCCFDRTVLMLYYKLLGKRIVFTLTTSMPAFEINNDTWVNRASLAAQYRLCDHIFVHTELMKRELSEGFGIKAGKVSVIPFGINNTCP
jgi:hypothetical protein